MQRQPHDVDRLLQQLRRDAGQQGGQGAVGRHQVPAQVDDQGGAGLVALEDQVDGPARRGQGGIVDRPLEEHRREAGGHQDGVAIAQGDLQLLRQTHDHLTAGLGAAGFQEAEVAGGDLGVERQVELAQATPLAPFAQVVADGLLGCGHGGNLAGSARRLHDLTGNGEHAKGRRIVPAALPLGRRGRRLK